MDESPIKMLVTKRDDGDMADRAVLANTPSGWPDIIAVPMGMMQRILIRSARVYLQSLSGLLSAGGLGLDRGLLPNEFQSLLWSAMGLSLAPAVLSAVMNGAELLTKLDESHPQLRG